MRALAAVIALALPVTAQDAPIALPSGATAYLQEVLTDRPGSGLTYRFRFVSDGFAPQAGAVDKVVGDLEHLCTAYALPRLSEIGPRPGQVIISLGDRPSEFGVADSTVRQVFEAFTIMDDRCIWEMF